MINVSTKFRNEMTQDDNRNFIPYADITLADGTVLNLTEKEIWQESFKIEDATSASGTFTIGAAVATKLTFTINNIYDTYSAYDFDGASIVARVGLTLADGTTEKLLVGYYTVTEPSYDGTTITLVCLDRMSKFNKAYSASTLTYPATLQTILQQACTDCGVPLLTTTFDNGSYSVATKPESDSLTYADIVACVAQIAGKFAKIDNNGYLYLGWYDFSIFEKNANLDGGSFDSASPYATGDTADGGNFTDYSSGATADGGTFYDQKYYHVINGTKSFKISTDDVIITGIEVTEDFTETDTQKMSTYLSGKTGYVAKISGNLLIQYGQAQTVADYLYSKIGGMRFRQFSATVLTDPTIEAGDIAYLTDRKSNVYQTIITSRSFVVGAGVTIAADAETPAKNSAITYSQMTKAVIKAREEAQQAIDNYYIVEQQMAQLVANSGGLFETSVQQSDGSYIYYFHNKSTLAASQIQWRCASDIMSVSTDYGKTWNAAISANGDVLAKNIAAIGINADWIHSGTLTLGGSDNTNGTLTIVNANGTTIGTWTKDGISINGGSISGTSINNGNGTFTVNANGNVVANSLSSANANITGGTININSAGEVEASKISIVGTEPGATYTASLSSFGLKCERNGYMESSIKITPSSITAPSLYDTTTGAESRTMTIGEGGDIGTNVSSRRFKQDIEAVKDFNVHALYDLTVSQFRYNEEHGGGDGSALQIGLIAEDVEEHFPKAARHDKNGQIISWEMWDMFPALLKLVQEQHEEIENLKTRIKAVERKMTL